MLQSDATGPIPADFVAAADSLVQVVALAVTRKGKPGASVEKGVESVSAGLAREGSASGVAGAGGSSSLSRQVSISMAGDLGTSSSAKTSQAPAQSADMLRLQRIVRVGNLDGRGAGGRGGGRAGQRARGGASAGGDDWAGGAGGSSLPADHAEAVENGTVVRNCVSLRASTGLLAVTRGTYIGFLDAQQHLNEMIAPALTAHVKASAEEAGLCGRSASTASDTTGATGGLSAASSNATAAQKSSYSLLHRHNARFTVLSVAFDGLLGRHLAVVGLSTVQVSLHVQPACTTLYAGRSSETILPSAVNSPHG